MPALKEDLGAGDCGREGVIYQIVSRDMLLGFSYPKPLFRALHYDSDPPKSSQKLYFPYLCPKNW